MAYKKKSLWSDVHHPSIQVRDLTESRRMSIKVGSLITKRARRQLREVEIETREAISERVPVEIETHLTVDEFVEQ